MLEFYSRISCYTRGALTRLRFVTEGGRRRMYKGEDGWMGQMLFSVRCLRYSTKNSKSSVYLSPSTITMEHYTPTPYSNTSPPSLQHISSLLPGLLLLAPIPRKSKKRVSLAESWYMTSEKNRHERLFCEFIALYVD